MTRALRARFNPDAYEYTRHGQAARATHAHAPHGAPQHMRYSYRASVSSRNLLPLPDTSSMTTIPPQVRTDKFSLHGVSVEMTCDVPWLFPQIDHLLGEFAVAGFPDGFFPAAGFVRRYCEKDV